MKRASWAKKIKKACEEAGTYRPYFDYTILTLSESLEKRDDAAQAYKDYGSIPLIEYTNKGGATNLVKNPALILWDDLNKSALAYWRDLGLTPAGLKKIDEQAMKQKKMSALEEAVAELGG